VTAPAGPTRGGALSRVPLRTQLVLLLTGTIALVVLATSLAGTAALRTYLVDRIDAQLVASLAEPVDGRGGPDGGPRGRRGPRRDVAVTTLQYAASGALLPASAVRLAALGGPDVPDPSALPDRPTEVDDVAADRRWRVLAGPAGDGGTVLVAVPLDGVQDTAARLLVINAALGLLALVAGGLLAWWAVRRSLQPLVTVEETAEVIAAGDLRVRVPYADPRTEVGSLAASFNAMVDRFETAYSAQQRSEAEARASEDRMRRFVADASHELRTPLTSVRGFAELFRQGAARDPEQLATVLRRIEDEAARMGLLVEDLLLLARLDQARALRQERVDLLTVATDVVAAAATVHGESHALELITPEGGLGTARGAGRRREAPPGRQQPGGQRRGAHRTGDDGPGHRLCRRQRRPRRGARRRSGHAARGGVPRLRALLPGRRLPHAVRGDQHRQRARPVDRGSPGRCPRGDRRADQHAGRGLHLHGHPPQEPDGGSRRALTLRLTYATKTLARARGLRSTKTYYTLTTHRDIGVGLLR